VTTDHDDEEGDRVRRQDAQWLRRGVSIALAMTAICLGAFAGAADAQTFSNADLAGVWGVYQLATPGSALTSGDDIRTYTGQVEFDANGIVNGDSSVVTDNLGHAYIVSGNFSVSTSAIVTGRLTLTGLGTPSGTLEVQEARLLVNRHTIIGVSKVLGTTIGLFTFAKQDDGQTFGVADIGGSSTLDWNYHELTPSNNLDPNAGAAWVKGVITFHGTDSNPGCSVADLVLPDGTIRASRTDGDGITSFQ
jgi:hypothetical protein